MKPLQWLTSIDGRRWCMVRIVNLPKVLFPIISQCQCNVSLQGTVNAFATPIKLDTNRSELNFKIKPMGYLVLYVKRHLENGKNGIRVAVLMSRLSKPHRSNPCPEHLFPQSNEFLPCSLLPSRIPNIHVLISILGDLF